MSVPANSDNAGQRVRSRLARRYAAEKRFRLYGMVAVGLAVSTLILLFATIFGKGYSAFWQANLRLEVSLSAEDLDPQGSEKSVKSILDRLAALGVSIDAAPHEASLSMVRKAIVGLPVESLAPLVADRSEFKTWLEENGIDSGSPQDEIRTALVENIAWRASAYHRTLNTADYQSFIRREIRNLFPEVTNRREKRALYELVSPGATYFLRNLVIDSPQIIGRPIAISVPLSDDLDQYLKGNISVDLPESDRRIKDKHIAWLESLQARGLVSQDFNAIFFTSGDSREPELAGIMGAVTGSFFTLLVTLILSFPIGVAAAVYLEEFAPTNRTTDFIEININNLAAVPSIVFGLLGLAVFLNVFGLPRSAPLVGGMILSLMTLPTIIIVSRAALKSVPPSIREAALGVGASHMQTVFHHVLPLALPGMLTGAIIGMARALGETAPLLMIGMVAFIVDVPSGILDPATALPVQIYLWADSPERGFVERTSAAIMVLLAFLVFMNATAVILRKKIERRW